MTASETELVSVIMPTFNASRTVGRAIDSLLSQSHRHWQLVTVDDASQDNTRETVAERTRAWGEERVTRRDTPRNGGPAQARNLALSLCRGRWIAVLDADDAWRPERLTTLLQTAGQAGADAVCDNLMAYDDHLDRAVRPIFATLPARLTIADAAAAEFQGRYNLGYLKPMVRQDFLRRHAIAYDESLRTGEDLLFLLELLANGGHVACTSKASYIYTTPVGPASGRMSRSSSTVPRDADLSAALLQFEHCHRQRLAADDHAAIAKRIAYLAAIEPVSAFRHARLTGDWIGAAALMRSPEVRRWVWGLLSARQPASH